MDHVNSRRTAPLTQIGGVAALHAAKTVLQAFVVLAALTVFVVLGVETRAGHFPWYDMAAMHYFHTHQSPSGHFLMRWVFTELGGTALISGMTAITALYFIKTGRFKPDGAVVLAAIIGGLALMESMKLLFPRPRAFHVDDHLGSSFPSGHIFFALTLYGLLAYWLTCNRPAHLRFVAWAIVLTITLLVGFSRIYVGAHYPTDVMAGFAMGLPWLYTWMAVLNRYRSTHHEPPGK